LTGESSKSLGRTSSWDGSKLGLIYTPRYSVLKVLEVTINRHFDELMKQGRFADFVITLWRKVVEDFEPKVGRLEGIRRMIEALERLAQYNHEKNKLRDPDTAAKETLRRNALTYLREVAKVIDLSPAKLVAKVVEYAAELGLVFRKPRWADEVDKVRGGLLQGADKSRRRPRLRLRRVCSYRGRKLRDVCKGAAVLIKLWIESSARRCGRSLRTTRLRATLLQFLAGSVLWPKNTKMLGRIPRTTMKRSDGTVEHYYKLTWQDFFEIFVGRLVAEDQQTTNEYTIYPGAGVSGGFVVSPPTPLTNLDNQATNVESAAPGNVDTSQEQSGLTPPPPSAGGPPVVSEGGGTVVISPQEPLTQVEERKEEVEAASLIGQEQSELTTGPHAPTTAVISPPSS